MQPCEGMDEGEQSRWRDEEIVGEVGGGGYPLEPPSVGHHGDLQYQLTMLAEAHALSAAVAISMESWLKEWKLVAVCKCFGVVKQKSVGRKFALCARKSV